MRWRRGAIALVGVAAVTIAVGTWAAVSAHAESAPLVRMEQQRMRALLAPAIPGDVSERWTSVPCDSGGEYFEYRRTATVTGDPDEQFESAKRALEDRGVQLFEADGMMFSYDRWLTASEAGEGFGGLSLGLANDQAQHAVSGDPGYEPDPALVPDGGNAIEAKVSGRCIQTATAGDRIGSALEPLLIPFAVLLFALDRG